MDTPMPDDVDNFPNFDDVDSSTVELPDSSYQEPTTTDTPEGDDTSCGTRRTVTP